MKKLSNYPVIIDSIRSPIGVKNGKMIGIRADDLTAQLIKALLKRNPLLPHEKIEDVIIGCAFPEAVQGMLLARGASILAGLPPETGAKVVNRFCGSSMDAVHQLDYAISMNDAQAGIAGGVEDMFAVPMGGYNPSFHRELYAKKYYISMGETAENLAREGHISREKQEEFAVHSHQKALSAWNTGLFKNEVVPVINSGITIDKDEGPREPDIEKIKSLKPVFDVKGTVTAATSSPYSIGASALLITSNQIAKEYGLKPRARILSRAVVGVDWTQMGIGPLPATEKALKRAGLTIKDIDIIELNEAFAAQSLYVINKGNWPVDKINLNGGAIALGHPLGCSGARIITTLINIMEQQNISIGLATMCIGGGQGITTILEKL
jgi:acetyl-CoA acyltransferase